jgi:hypothetical protein
MALDELSKQYTETLTGKPYEPGDLSKELDARVKSTVAEYCGKETYEVRIAEQSMTHFANPTPLS